MAGSLGPEEVEALARRRAGEVYGAALLYLGDGWEAAAATREAFARALRGAAGFRGRSEEEARAWVLRLGSIEARRREARGGGAAAGGDRGEDAKLEEALRALEPGEREALILRDVEGLGVAEAAEAMGIGASPFRSRLHRARLAVSGLDGGGASGREHRRARASLSAYLDGELSARERERLEAHTASCEECGRELDALRRTVAELGRLAAQIRIPPGLVDSVVERLREGG